MREQHSSAVEHLPGYRRRLRIIPSPNSVRAEMEDDYHHMAVVLRHEHGLIIQASAEQQRAPWSTCPGAIAQLARDFDGAALADLPRAQHVKPRNCTHLYDLAVLAAAHAYDAATLVFDVLASDPVDGQRLIELRTNGSPVMQWVEQNGRFSAPSDLAGLNLFSMGDWIRGLPEGEREAARVLRWGARIARGRMIPLERQSDARAMPLSCYTFQPAVAVHARRTGDIRDFSAPGVQPLDGQTGSRL